VAGPGFRAAYKIPSTQQPPLERLRHRSDDQITATAAVNYSTAILPPLATPKITTLQPATNRQQWSRSRWLG